MTLEDLDKEILKRREELDDSPKKEAYDFIKEFMNNNNLDNITDFLQIDIWEFIKCSLYLRLNKKSIDDYSKLIDTYKDVFSSIKNSSLEELLNILLIFNNAGKTNDLIEYFKSKGFINELKHLRPLADVDSVSTIKIGALKKKLDNENIDFVPFLKEIKENGETFLKEIAFYNTYVRVLEFLNNRVIPVNADCANERIFEERKNSAIANTLRDAFDVDAILSKMNEIKAFKDEYERIERNNQREKTGLNISREALEKNIEKKHIIMYRDIIKGLKNPRIKYLFLSYIREHNDEYVEELEQELSRLKQDSKVSIQALLNDYGITKDSYDFEILPSYSKEEFETILKVISKFEITNEEKIRIIKSTTLDRILLVKSFLDKEILLPEYVSNNTNILDEESKELDYLKENIELLKSYGIPSSVFLNSINILMNEPSVIRNNIDILNVYNLLVPLATTSEFEFLLRDDLESVIDKYLELGFEEYLESDLNLLNKTQLERIEVLKAIGIPINSREELEHILNEDKKFFIALDEIEIYLPDGSKYVKEPSEVVTVGKLEEYKKTDRVYEFNGIKISIEKVNRLINQGYSMYQAIISNTHLSEEELSDIIKIIEKNKVKELRMN